MAWVVYTRALVSPTCASAPRTEWVECIEWTDALVSDTCLSPLLTYIGCGRWVVPHQLMPSLATNEESSVADAKVRLYRRAAATSYSVGSAP